MPLRDFKCLDCGAVEEHYYSSTTESKQTCDKCGGATEKAPLSARAHRRSNIFPYTSTHITGDGKPVTITDIGHLRSLERRYGVCVSAFSQNDNNPDSPRDLPETRPGGEEYTGPRMPWARRR
jgi:hypothetical protein